MQERYWRLMQQLRADGYYFSEYAVSIDKTNDRITVIIAVASSVIAGLGAYQKTYPLIWTLVVVALQAISVYSHNRPLKKRVGALHALSQDIDSIYLQAEDEWYHVANGERTESEINDTITDLKQQHQKAETKRIAEMPLPKDAKHRETADRLTEAYFFQTFNVRSTTE